MIRSKNVLLAIAVGAFSSLCGSKASADLVLRFGESGAPTLSTIDANAGSSFNLDLFVVQEGLNGGLPDDRLNTEGIGGYDIAFSIGGSGGIAISNPILYSFSPGLDALGSEATRVDAQYAEFAGNGPASGATVSPVVAPIGTDFIRLGTISLEVSAGASGPFTIDLQAPSPSFNSLGTDPFNTFVPTSASSTINVTAVPEPSSLALLSCVGLVGLIVRRHKQSGN